MTSTLSSNWKRDCSAAYTDGWACYKLPVPAVVGIAVGCVIFVFILGAVIFLCCRRRKQKQKRQTDREENIAQGGALKREPIAFNPDAY